MLSRFLHRQIVTKNQPRRLPYRRLHHLVQPCPNKSHHVGFDRTARPRVALHSKRSSSFFHYDARTQSSSPSSSTTVPTIYALSTASGRAAIAIIRLSGPACLPIYRRLCPSRPDPKPRYATVRAIHHPSPRSPHPATLLDPSALILYFPAPYTATGEPVLELHIHGGPALVRAILAALASCSTPDLPVRYAEPGEFTRRAFLHDRLDLTQVEALSDLLSAETEEQLRLSVQGTASTSNLAARYESWRRMLLAARAELEALIDFSEDQHFDEAPAELVASVVQQARRLKGRLSVYGANAMRGELLRGGVAVALVGAPNVGKSSLLNEVVGRNAAIVSGEAGTTRDVVEVAVDVGGFFCRIGDTAGIRQDRGGGRLGTSGVRGKQGDEVGEVEKEGIRRAKAKALQSNVVIVVMAIEPSVHGQGFQLQVDEGVLAVAREVMESKSGEVLVAVNKMDLYGTLAEGMTERIVSSVRTALPAVAMEEVFPISCHRSQAAQDDSSNIQNLLEALIGKFKSMTAAVESPLDAELDSNTLGTANQWQETLGASQRQRQLLDSCQAHLQDFIAQVKQSTGDGSSEFDIVIAAEALRAAANDLGRITGRSETGGVGDVEEVLGVVFEKFCVGK